MMYNTGNMKILKLITLTFVVFSTFGCSSGSLKYRNYQADTSYIAKVAVLPFNNLSNDNYASERVRTMFIVDLMSRNRWEVVEQGEVSKVLGQILRASGAIEGGVIEVNNETLKLLGERLGVQAVIVGSVNEYITSSSGSSGSMGEISVASKMLDAASGVVLWQSISTVSAGSALRNFLGLRNPNRSVITKKAVHKSLNTLPK